ncbi:conserved repeat domain-containing protein [Halogranum gelatinilyticum]|uniref:Conserved repeat domain-containing protein n=1 Tax=Halogranum gelatinilyticum TaxID=660521 RepID=A0A1G9XIP1_9EURY|nr:DUF58 domain-containing protein [Halogranum gelatinilyticum]SDM96702.1 conserved repeat domain-containing protein [Halogranum gelatinilyticum]
MTVARDRRWNVGLAGTLVLVVVGLVYADPLLFTAALVPLAYVVFGALSSLPTDADLAVERTVTPSSPAPGERVTVSLTLENTGETTLPDVRAVDGVPEELAVTDGSPRVSGALRPGATVTAEYELVARRGDHAFDEPLVRVRTVAATHVLTDRLAVSGATTLACHGVVNETPVTTATSRVGTRTRPTGGEGLEFHSTREYRSGDPKSRIDWRGYAKRGELTTVNFTEERSASVALVVDGRAISRVSSRLGFPTGTELAAYAAERTFVGLRAAGHDVRVTALGLDDGVPETVTVTPDGLPWVDSTASGNVRAQATALFEAVRATAAGRKNRDSASTAGRGRHTRSPATDGGDPLATRLAARLPSDTSVVVFSPLLDDDPATLATDLARRGYDTLVVSPDVVGNATPGQSLAGIQRQVRLRRLDGGVTAADWDPADPLELLLERTLSRLL